MSEKKKLERAAFDYFIDVYNHQSGTTFVFRKHHDKPDIIAIDDNKNILGVEITHLYYGDEEAKLLLGRSDKKTFEMVALGGLIENLNELLNEKIKQAKNYKFNDDVILVIRVASPVFEISDFEHQINTINIPKNTFTEIWLLAHDSREGAWKGLKQLQ